MHPHYWTFQFGRAAIIFTQYEAAAVALVVFILCLVAFLIGRVSKRVRPPTLMEKSMGALAEMQRRDLESKVEELTKSISQHKANAVHTEHRTAELVKASRDAGLEEGRITTTNEIRQTLATFLRSQADFLEGEGVQIVENTHTLNRGENFRD